MIRNVVMYSLYGNSFENLTRYTIYHSHSRLLC